MNNANEEFLAEGETKSRHAPKRDGFSGICRAFLGNAVFGF
jgi:hypothetical protein